MAGGFAHEMRNALTGAQIAMTKVYKPAQNEKAWSTCNDNRQKLRSLVSDLSKHIPEAELRGYVQHFNDLDRAEEKLEKVLRMMQLALSRGLAITTVTLNYAQISKARPGIQTISIPKLVSTVLEDVQQDLKAHAITVEADIPEQCALVGTEVHFHSILKNLVSNARDALIDPSVAGQRTLSIRALDEPDRVVLSVQDTGAGISAKVRDLIFEPFFSTKPTTGTGLGLGLVRKIASLYGGDVDFESTPQQGTTFRVVIPKPLLDAERLA